MYKRQEEDKVDVDVLLKNIVTEKSSVKKEEVSSYAEAPTKEFIPAKRPEQGVGVQTVKKNLPPVNPPSEFKKEKDLPEPAADISLENSEKFSIDIEGIREEYKPVSYTHLDVYKRQG